MKRKEVQEEKERRQWWERENEKGSKVGKHWRNSGSKIRINMKRKEAQEEEKERTDEKEDAKRQIEN